MKKKLILITLFQEQNEQPNKNDEEKSENSEDKPADSVETSTDGEKKESQ